MTLLFSFSMPQSLIGNGVNDRNQRALKWVVIPNGVRDLQFAASYQSSLRRECLFCYPQGYTFGVNIRSLNFEPRSLRRDNLEILNAAASRNDGFDSDSPCPITVSISSAKSTWRK